VLVKGGFHDILETLPPQPWHVLWHNGSYGLLRRASGAVTAPLPKLQTAHPPTPPGAGTSVGAGATSITINSSTGVAFGDVIFAYVGTQSASAIDVTTPTGWTLISGPLTQRWDQPGAIQSYLFQRISDGTDGASYTFNFSGAVTIVGYASQITYRGVNNTTPVDGSITTATQTTGTSIALPAVSPVGPSDLLVAFVADYGGFSATAAATQFPSRGYGGTGDEADYGGRSTTAAATGMTNEMQPINQNAILDQQLTSAGSTGARTATGLASSVSAGFLFAVRPSRGVIKPVRDR
jgi:hypothetical protein